MTDPIISEIDQAKSGAVAIAVGIVQILAESDSTIPGRLNTYAAEWYEKLSERGEPHGAEMVYMFGRAMIDPELFP